MVRRHRADDTVARAITRIMRADLVVVDDIGMLPVGPDAAEGFYRLVDAAYERRALAVSSNLHPAGFDELMPKTLATATVDRLLHHAHVCVTQGESFRLSQATAGKGVMPYPAEQAGRPGGHERRPYLATTGDKPWPPAGNPADPSRGRCRHWAIHPFPDTLFQLATVIPVCRGCRGCPGLRRT